jgi:hypothetical protein
VRERPPSDSGQHSGRRFPLRFGEATGRAVRRERGVLGGRCCLVDELMRHMQIASQGQSSTQWPVHELKVESWSCTGRDGMGCGSRDDRHAMTDVTPVSFTFTCLIQYTVHRSTGKHLVSKSVRGHLLKASDFVGCTDP